jgi:hypothetical protein
VPRSLSDEELERVREVSDRVREHLRRYNQVLPGTRMQAAPLLPDLLDEIDRLRSELDRVRVKEVRSVRAENVVPPVTISGYSAPPLCQCARMAKHFRDDPWPPGDGPIAMQARL